MTQSLRFGQKTSRQISVRNIISCLILLNLCQIRHGVLHDTFQKLMQGGKSSYKLNSPAELNPVVQTVHQGPVLSPIPGLSIKDRSACRSTSRTSVKSHTGKGLSGTGRSMKKDLIRSCSDASEETEVLPVADRVVAMADRHPFGC
jgi:hypothetical protein